jgi:putative heme-binding domain-containing protein
MAFTLNSFRLLTVGLAAALLAGANIHAEPAGFSDIIRKTNPLPPDQEQKAFHLPPGFEIDLVAAEPDIAKPINMQFDDKGRLWLSQSKEYPFPAPTNRPARDAIKILSDFRTDGRAQKITTFATNLNIPIGLYPYRDGALGYSIPYIYFFHDTKGEGHADTQDIFLGKFSFDKDTHGMTSCFRRGYDGLFYANHGFNNTSTLVAKDGSTITMHSGNTYRIRLDGTHLEQFVWGRVNPFGLMFDPLGNLYSSDCETWPIYNLLRGGYYPSFGIPDDGLGFAPAMMDHKHGSTAIAGVVYYAATNFPEEFRDNIFVGNVMTCRIDRDALEMHGSTGIAREKPDFLSCDDPWFRPVDLQLGPDGALYMADFYNRIIGHYEVPLDNPGRDRERGRIWRIRYVGEHGEAAVPSAEHWNFTKDSVAQLIRLMGDSNITVRMLAMNELTDRIGAACIKPIAKMMRQKNASVFQRIHGMWVLYRFNALDPDILAAAAHDADNRLRVHAMRVFAELPQWTPDQHAVVIEALLHDSDPLVQRCAADALGQHPAAENMRPLLDARHVVPADDTHLLYVIRMALRNQLRVSDIYATLPLSRWTDDDENAVADVSLAVPSAASADYLLHHLQKGVENREMAATQLRHITRYLPESDIPALADFARKKFGDDVDLQLALYKNIRESLEQRGTGMPEDMRQWGSDLVGRLLAPSAMTNSDWHNVPIPGIDSGNPWSLQQRPSTDGKNAEFVSSLPAGEGATGMLRSKPFVIPKQLSFYVAGHDGYPDKAAYNKNFVRLCDAETGKVLRLAHPPRHDTAHQTKWDLSDEAGKMGYLEIVDANTEGGYAWLAFGRLEPEVVPFPLVSPNMLGERMRAAAELAGSLHLESAEASLAKLLTDPSGDIGARSAAAKSLAEIHPDRHLTALGGILMGGDEPASLRAQCAQSLAAANTPDARAVLVSALPAAPLALQTEIALALASSPEGAEALLQAVSDGKGSARLLQNRLVMARLDASKPNDLDARVAKLTKGLPPADAERQKIIDERAATFNPQTASATGGAEIFRKNCMICHSIAGQGARIGPTLDGIGNRGIPRVTEDILDPSRNVDRAFRVTIFTMRDGDVQTGLFRREEGQMVIVAQPNGQEISIPKGDIAERRESELSLMPDNFAQILPPKDFYNLLAYLTSKNVKDAGK